MGTELKKFSFSARPAPWTEILPQLNVCVLKKGNKYGKLGKGNVSGDRVLHTDAAQHFLQTEVSVLSADVLSRVTQS